MSYIGSLDQGTSSTRFIIFDHEGHMVGHHQSEHRQILPQPGWVEHDAVELWQRAGEAIVGALQQSQLTGHDLRAIGIANQRETIVAWDITTGLPLENAIVWQDVRTANYLSAFSDKVQKTIRHKTGLTIAPYFSASKIHWLLENSEAIQKSLAAGTARIGTVDSWLLWNLSGGVKNGVHLTDVTNASRTMLMNLETLDWDDELLSIFGIPRSLLPNICSSSQVFAYSDPTGPLGSSTPIAGILGDQQAAMVGQLCFNRGESKTTYGTGNFALLNTGTEIVRSKHGLLTTVLVKLGDAAACFALEGSVAVTGSAIQWLRDQLGVISSSSDIEGLAGSVSDNGGVYFVPAFSGLFAPYWRSDARGVIVGLTQSANRAHLARATLESICYQTREIIEAMIADSGVEITEMRVDGGITSNQLCMQMQADILGIDIIRPAMGESTALGAAYVAGLAVDFWSSTDELRIHERISRLWKPAATPQTRNEGYRQWRRAVERTLNWIETTPPQ
jgi:glycerol kinase